MNKFDYRKFIKVMREEPRVNVSDLATCLGVDIRTLEQYEKGELELSREQLITFDKFISELPPIIKKKIKDEVDQLLSIVEKYGEIAVDYTKQGNEFEFKVCDLLLKGAAGAFSLYLIGLGLVAGDKLPRVEPLLFWGASLVVGIHHQLLWSRRLLALGEEHRKVSSRIFASLRSPQVNSNKLLAQIYKEDEKYRIAQNQGKKIDPKEFYYVITRNSYGQLGIVTQIFLLSLGVIFALWGMTTTAIDYHEIIQKFSFNN